MLKESRYYNWILAVIGIIVLFIVYTVFWSYPYANSKIPTTIKTLSLEDYEVGYMIESGDFMLYNVKSKTIDYLLDDSLSKVLYIQMMNYDQNNYNQNFEKSKEKKK